MRSATLLAFALLAAPSTAAAQRLLDLPVRTGAEPEALVVGAAAAFWNPASAAELAGRGEAVLMDVNGPEATGLGGFAGAAAFRLDPLTVLAVGYRHAAIEDIERTSTSPMPDPEGLDVAEDVFGLAAGRRVGTRAAVGVSVEYTRPAAELGTDSRIVIGAGGRLAFGGPWRPVVAGAVQAEEGEPGWLAGAEAAPLFLSRGDWAGSVAYGLSGGPRRRGLEHRASGRVTWSDRVSVSAGLAAADDDGGTAVTFLGGILVHVSRYTVGIVREQLAHDFGAVHSLRLGVGF